MIKAHQTCPICNSEFVISKHVNERCVPLDMKLSFIEYKCSQSKPYVLPKHSFFQITSLYGELLFEKIYFPKNTIVIEDCDIKINYVAHDTIFSYFSNKEYRRTNSEKVHIKNRLVSMDYPHLTKAINKLKSLAMLL